MLALLRKCRRAALAALAVTCILLGFLSQSLPDQRLPRSSLSNESFATPDDDGPLRHVAEVVDVAAPTTSRSGRSHSRIAVCFVTQTLSSLTLRLAHDIAQLSTYDVFVVEDEGIYNSTDPLVTIVHYDDLLMREQNYTSLSHKKGSEYLFAGTKERRLVNAWDKSVYLFTQDNRLGNAHEFVWMIEPDVFLPTVGVLKNLTETAMQNSYDFVTSTSKLSYNEWPWAHEFPSWNVTVPWTRAMMCMVGFSRKMLNAVVAFRDEHKSFMFMEVFFPTIAIQSQARWWQPEEMSTIVWRHNWTVADIHGRPNNIFHPIKDMQLQAKLRRQLTAAEDRRNKRAANRARGQRGF